MMEAVARHKAHWLFRSGSQEMFSGRKRPQEDLVTSAVFGSINLLGSTERRQAIELLVGPECRNLPGFPVEGDVEVRLWPRLYEYRNRQVVEPDVILVWGKVAVIVEVKWHAQLSHKQIDQQIGAAEKDYDVLGAVLLGEEGSSESIRFFRRTWRDVSYDLRREQAVGDSTWTRWAKTVFSFLQETDMGRIFNSIDPAKLCDPGWAIYSFDHYSARLLPRLPTPIVPVFFSFGTGD